jgi:hypothetical protein
MRPYYHCDTECYPNYWIIGFRYHDDPNVTFSFVKYNDSPLDIPAIVNILHQVTIITFNGNHYDENMILYALCGATNEQLFQLNNLIILGGAKSWEVKRNILEPYYGFGGRPDWLDHIDISEPAPGVKVSLKIYMGRTHSRKMQDLPIIPGTLITDADLELMETYRGNDEEGTFDLFNKIRDRIDLRIKMSEKFGVDANGRYILDLRSKSDAQIAEAVIRERLGFKVDKPFWPHGTEFKYTPPAFVRFITPQLQTMFEMVKAAVFKTSDKDQVYEGDEVDDSGKPIKIKTGIIMPDEVKQCRITIGNSVYKFGIGGLHSMEHGRAYIAGNGWTISDHDATSFYPITILNNGYYPKQMGPKFLEVYGAIVYERIDDKGNLKYCEEMAEQAQAAMYAEYHTYWDEWRKYFKTEESSLKIVINGSFGKFGSKYSILFSPDLLIQTTITGQLSLLMLIESLEQAGISVVSANTDGIVVLCPPGMQFIRDEVIKAWEVQTRYTTEQTDYVALYSRDVNNYLAVKPNGKVKRKGVFAEPTLQKSPNNTICVEAVVQYLTTGKPMADTITGCTDVRQFLTIRGVKGGAVKGDILLGKAVRWYYALNEYGTINYKTNGNRVPRSEGARPLMELPDTLPGDIDYNWYIREANAILTEIGFK